jgi:hypothetical protein
MRRTVFYPERAGALPLFGCAFVLLIGLCGAAWTRAAAAPDFTLTDLDGKAHSLAEYRGKIVVLNFWATSVRTGLFPQ